MLYDFLYNCNCVLNEEVNDYQALLNSFEGKSACVGFMPAITDDLYPVFTLSCTSAKQIISPDVYIIPVGAHDYWAKPYFEEIINKFYKSDEFNEQFDIELEEMLLLNNTNLGCFFSLTDGTNCNVVFCRIALPDGSERYLFVLPETPDDCWKNIIEQYEINCGIVIDSLKGMGDWFDSVPLYRVMRETNATELLPRYYFKGLYISHDAPCGFNMLYTIPDIIINRQGKIVDDWQKEIYEIDWNENKKNN